MTGVAVHQPQEEPPVTQAILWTQRPLVCFFIFAMIMCAVAGVALISPQTSLSVIWEIKPNDYQMLLAFAPWSGVGFLLLSALMAAAAWGTAHRTWWSWQLSIVTFLANGIGDALQMVAGRVMEGAVGVMVTGAIVYWLMRRKV